MTKITRENALKVMGRKNLIAGLKKISNDKIISPSLRLRIQFTCASVWAV